MRALPSSLQPLAPLTPFAGRALPVRHAGSVDIFLEALTAAHPGDVVTIDNGALMDEACIGDLVVREMQMAGIAGVIVWGCHRDSAELAALGLPILSLGRCPAGPPGVRERAADALECAHIGAVTVCRDDLLFVDDDGAVAVGASLLDRVLAGARHIAGAERRQAAAMQAGTTLRAQLDFASYLALRAEDPTYTFRVHLRRIGGAVEE